MRQCSQHAEESEGGEDCQEDIVRDNEGLENACLRKCIRLVSTLAVYAVPDYGGDGIECSDRDWHFPVESGIVDAGVDAKGRGKCAGVCRRRKREWLVVRWELEKPTGWYAKVD